MTDTTPPDPMRTHWETAAEQYEAEGDAFTSQFAEEAWRLAASTPEFWSSPSSVRPELVEGHHPQAGRSLVESRPSTSSGQTGSDSDQPGPRVLDVATGVGALLLPALRGGTEAHAIDFSEAMIARARRRAAEIDPAAADRVVRMDGQALAYADGAFDAVFSIFGVMLFPDPDAGTREMARVLRPGGIAVMGAWQSATGAGPALLFQQALAELFPGMEFGSAMGERPLFNTPELMEAGFARAGLERQAVHFVTRPWPMPAPDWPRKNAQLAFGWSPAWQQLDEADRARLIEAVEAKIATGTTMQATALIGMARKP